MMLKHTLGNFGLINKMDKVEFINRINNGFESNAQYQNLISDMLLNRTIVKVSKNSICLDDGTEILLDRVGMTAPNELCVIISK